ncbi:MAG: SAM-dependent methyltransferase, partial [bacterium]
MATLILKTVMTWFFRFGKLTLIDADEKHYRICDCDGPAVVVRVVDHATALRLATGSSLAWGEAYMDGRLVIVEGTLANFLEIYTKSEFAINFGRIGELFRIGYGIIATTQHHNPIGRAKKNIAHHYDLSAELYSCFLDADRQYSCAYFKNGNEDIETAQLQKKQHIAAKLCIEPGMRILDIGSGWGGMGLYLAEQFDCNVSGVTLSEEQFKLSNLRARKAGLDSKVKFELCDYRSLDGSFDRIVSVGMLEHVGQFQYDEYFGKVRDLLSPDGVALIHT